MKLIKNIEWCILIMIVMPFFLVAYGIHWLKGDKNG